jgi:hypothetical protein
MMMMELGLAEENTMFRIDAWICVANLYGVQQLG